VAALLETGVDLDRRLSLDLPANFSNKLGDFRDRRTGRHPQPFGRDACHERSERCETALLRVGGYAGKLQELECNSRTMGCGDACPIYPGKRYEDWALADPAGKSVDAVRPIRDEIERRGRALPRS
jgi:hypothetical protein